MSRQSSRNRYRIIGGEWRGRALNFPDAEGLRPTLGRIRETLFNWLRLDIAGAHCLDLFAGSGALGFEALSRGAAAVTGLETDARAAAALQRNRRDLGADDYQLLRRDALDWLARERPLSPYHIAFLDPPYASGGLARCCELLEAGGWLAAGAAIYLEDDQALDRLALPAGWRLDQHKRAGQVHYGLCRRN